MKNVLTYGALTLIPLAFGVPEAQAQENPRIIFISENGTAQSAIESTVAREYNAQRREELRTSNPEAFENYEDVDFRGVPGDFRNARYEEIKTALGLSDDDPADLGFTELLAAAGYDVHRSESTFEVDDFSGVTTEDHEFWPEIGERDADASDEFNLSQEQIDTLNAADLIIFSADTNHTYYARGRSGGEADYSLRDQWLGLETPMIVMNNALITSHEWNNWGWGLSYGFSYIGNTLFAYNRREADPQYVFPDMRPQVVDSDAAILAGITPVDDQRVSIYKDYSDFPVLPRTVQKYENNNNFSYGSNAKVVLELQLPSFIDASAGEIATRDPVLIEFTAGVPGFQPEDGVPSGAKVGTPNSPVVYFAASMAGTGLYNLSETGEDVFLNTVEKLAGGAAARTWYGYNVDADGMVDTGEWMGMVYVDNDPWIYVYDLGGYIYMSDDSGWAYVPN